MFGKRREAIAVLVGCVCALAGLSAHNSRAAKKDQTSCPKFVVIGSRGSGDNFSGNAYYTKYDDKATGMSAPGGVFAVALANNFLKGQVTFIRNYYKASGGLLAMLGAGSKASLVGAYHDSVVEGKQILARLISDEMSQCPAVKMILVGYSQGAQVTGDVYQSLSPKQREAVLGVVLFGDPKYDKSSFADTVKLKHNGFLGARGEFPKSTSGLVLSYCHPQDPVCQGWTQSIHGSGAHATYQIADAKDAAQRLAKMALAGHHQTTPKPKTGEAAGNSVTYIARSDNGYVAKVTLTTYGMFHANKLPAFPGPASANDCTIDNASTGIVEASFSITNETKNFPSQISAEVRVDQKYPNMTGFSIDTGNACWEPTFELLVSSTGTVSYGGVLSFGYLIIVPNYFSPDHPKGDRQLVEDVCTSLSIFFGPAGSRGLMLPTSRHNSSLPLIRGIVGCGNQ